MKKLILSSLFSAATFIASAAAVNWSSGTKNDGFLDHNGTEMKNYTAYTMSVYFYSDAGITQFGDVSTASKGNSLTGEYKASPSGFELSTEETTVTYYCKAIITGKDGEETWTRETTLADFSMSKNGDKTINFMTGDGFNTAGAKWGDWTKGASPVPEPFSGSLALLGVGLVALRRRMKKAKKA